MHDVAADSLNGRGARSEALHNTTTNQSRALADIFHEACRKRDDGDFVGAVKLLDGFGYRVAGLTSIQAHGDTPPRPKLSVVIVSHEDNADVSIALDEVSKQCSDSAYEIVLVENGNDQLFAEGRRSFSQFRGIRPPFPLGCSAGRNLGAHFATSPFVLFLDDDGIIEAGCVAALMACIEETGAVGVRGKVVPRSPSGAAGHYNLGDQRIPAIINCEGVSIWRREIFLEEGGFNALLAGHEGTLLCARCFPHFGPLAFVYEPAAVLRHDYANSAGAAEDKNSARTRNENIVNYLNKDAFDIYSKIFEIPRDGRSSYLSMTGLEESTSGRNSQPGHSDEAVSVITTARNGAEHLSEFTRCWHRQSHGNFQLVFVDDGSADGTADAMEDLWQGDQRLTLIRQDFRGRGAALNTAFAAASHEICLIADVDDLSTPARAERTVDFFRSHRDVDYMSFLTFNESDLFRIGPPHSPFLRDMDVRSLFGMPAAFPAFACKKSRFTAPFDTQLRGGVDCDWLHRNIAENKVKGRLVHLPMVYYRQHSGQITNNHNDIQREVRKKIVYYAFARVLGQLGEQDKQMIDIVVDRRHVSPAQRRRLGLWLTNFLRSNNRREVYDPTLLASALIDAYSRLPAASAIAQEINSLRSNAEFHIARKEFKEARRNLRSALRLRDDPDVKARLRSAHRWWIVRQLWRSKPFVG